MAEKTRAELLKDSCSMTEQTRDNLRLVIERGPEVTNNAAGDPVCIEVWVRLYDGEKEVRIDGHRRFINPPLGIFEDKRQGFDVLTQKVIEPKIRHAPEEAFWSILWDSVTTTPNRRHWKKRST